MTNCPAMANKVGDVSEKATTEAKRIKFVQNPDSQLADFNKLFYHIINFGLLSFEHAIENMSIVKGLLSLGLRPQTGA